MALRALLPVVLLLFAAPLRAMPHAIVVDARSGVLLGSATLVGGDRVLTSRHVVEPALRRDAPVAVVVAGQRAPARIAATSDRLDLAVLAVPRALASAPALRLSPPAPGVAVAAPSPQGVWVQGAATRFAWREAWGPAVFARLAVGFGFSGGPLVDAEGRLIGLVTAAVNPSARQMTALRSDPGRTPDAGAEPPVVFVLPIGALLEEARRIDPGCCAAR